MLTLSLLPCPDESIISTKRSSEGTTDNVCVCISNYSLIGNIVDFRTSCRSFEFAVTMYATDILNIVNSHWISIKNSFRYKLFRNRIILVTIQLKTRPIRRSSEMLRHSITFKSWRKISSVRIGLNHVRAIYVISLVLHDFYFFFQVQMHVNLQEINLYNCDSDDLVKQHLGNMVPFFI